MSLLSSIKNWFERKLRIAYLKDFISVDSIDIKNIFNIENTHYQIKETKYVTLDRIQYIVNKLNRCLETGEPFDRKLLSVEDKTNTYINEFIYSKYEGISDYSEKIKVFMNSVIELDANIQFENIKDIGDKNNSVIMVAEYVIKDLYSIYNQLLEINKEINRESIIGRRR